MTILLLHKGRLFQSLLLCLFACSLSVWAQSANVAEVTEEWDPISATQRPVVRLIDGGRNIRVNLSRNVRTVDRVSLYGLDRVLVIGRTSNAELLTVVSRSAAAVEDEFLAYDASVSPSGRYVAFERFWQPHGPDVAPVVMIYDLAATAQANRVVKGSGFDSLKYAGRLLFPPNRVRAGDYEEQPRASSSPRRITNLFWLDGETLCFIAYTTGASQLVVVRGTQDFSRPQYQYYLLDHGLVVNERALGAGDDPALQFSGARIEADSTGRNLTIELIEGSQFKTRTLSVRR